MGRAKDLIVQPIGHKRAADFVKKTHYSGKVVNNSTLHFGVFIDGIMDGVMSFGTSMDKRKTLGLVEGTAWNGSIELNRMAFGERLPRNSESRALSVAIRLIKTHYPHIEWIISFSDGCQCGDGVIYRASGFKLSGIKKNTTMLQLPNGEIVAKKTLDDKVGEGGVWGSSIAKANGAVELAGFMLRYIYFIHPTAESRLTKPLLSFSEIEKMGAGMYKGTKIKRVKKATSGDHPESGGAVPTDTLQSRHCTNASIEAHQNG